MDIGEIFGTIIGAILMIYVAYILIIQFSQTTAGFAFFGWILFIAILISAVITILKVFQK